MRTATRHEGRLVWGGAEARSLLWRIASMILLFNGLLVAWVLLKPGSDAVFATVVNVAEFVGPLLVLPLCFGGLVRVWRRGISQTDGSTAVTLFGICSVRRISCASAPSRDVRQAKEDR